MQDGSFRPLPFREFPVARVAEAFDHMAQSRHIGKLVISLAGVDAAMVGRRRRRGRPLQDIIGSTAALLADTGVAGVVAKDWEPDSQPAATEPCPPTGDAISGAVGRDRGRSWKTRSCSASGISVDDNFLIYAAIPAGGAGSVVPSGLFQDCR